MKKLIIIVLILIENVSNSGCLPYKKTDISALDEKRSKKFVDNTTSPQQENIQDPVLKEILKHQARRDTLYLTACAPILIAFALIYFTRW